MYFIMKCTGGPFGDCSYSYDVDFNGLCSVNEVVKFILSRGEWGEIFVNDNFCIEYKKDLLFGNFPKELITAEVDHIKANGGWTLMYFYIFTKQYREEI